MKTTKPKITMSEMMKRPGMAKANPEIASGLRISDELRKDPIVDMFINPIAPNGIVDTKHRLLKKQSQHERLISRFLGVWQVVGGLPLKAEHQFHPFRRWRFDFVNLETKVAIELEGGIFLKNSGHSSITGILRDIEKYNQASLMGFKVFRFSTKDINIQTIKPVADHIKQIHDLFNKFGI